MVQYLLNLTAIWLLSLFLYEVLLKKESFHNYNRGYLLFTLMLGILLPLWQQNSNVQIYHMPAVEQYHRFTTDSQVIVSKAVKTYSGPQVNWLLVIYLSGVAIALLSMFREVYILISYYRKGRRA